MLMLRVTMFVAVGLDAVLHVRFTRVLFQAPAPEFEPFPSCWELGSPFLNCPRLCTQSFPTAFLRGALGQVGPPR